MTKALIMVDLQNDFCPLGSLAVPEGDLLPAMANQLQPYFEWIIATKDWHPSQHKSFASSHPSRMPYEVINLSGLPQILWPEHCVQETPGSDFHPVLDTAKIHQIFYKGTDPEIDSYSAFFDNAHLKSTGLAEWLHKKNITDVYLMGLATDYCVKYSCLDACNCGFNVYLIVDACRGVALQQGDCEKALKEMQQAGVKFVKTNELLAPLKPALRTFEPEF